MVEIAEYISYYFYSYFITFDEGVCVYEEEKTIINYIVSGFYILAYASY